MRNVYLTSAIFLIHMIFCSTTPTCQGQEQPHVVQGPRPPRPPPFTPVPGLPKPPGPPSTPVPHPPGTPPPDSLLQVEQPQMVRGPKPPRPPMPPKPPGRPPMPPKPPGRSPRPPQHNLLEAEATFETCYPNNNELSPTGCERMCKENGYETKHSYYIERQDAKWECCCPH